MLDLHSMKLVPASKMEDYYGGIKAKGGVLADAVGLGKTLERKSFNLYKHIARNHRTWQ